MIQIHNLEAPLFCSFLFLQNIKFPPSVHNSHNSVNLLNSLWAMSCMLLSERTFSSTFLPIKNSPPCTST